MVGNPALKIASLRALIAHPHTGAGERAVAERMLNRLVEKTRGSVATGRTYGVKHARAGRHASLTRITDSIREDILLARHAFCAGNGRGEVAVVDPVGDAPPGITYEVDARHESEIVITIGAIPQDWGWQFDGGVKTASPALDALAASLSEIMNSYNHDGPDITKRFFGRVRAEGENLVW